MVKKQAREVAPKLAVILLVLLACGLRTYHLDHFSFWEDEGLTPLRSGYSLLKILSNEIVVQGVVTKDTHPPFYYLLIHFSRLLLGDSDFAFRLPSAFAGVLLIPLLYVFGIQMRSRRLGLLAALLAAINPLQIWYAQEARMYTLLVFLAAVASYALWRAWRGYNLTRWFSIYVVFAGLTFLTHYTAIFLIAGQAPFWVWLLWERGHRRLLVVGAVVAAIVLVPFLPLTIPRLFGGPEANYFYVSPLTMLQDVVHGFGMGMTVEFSRWTIRLLDAIVALLLILGLLAWRRGAKGRRASLFLIVYLLAVVAGLALGSLIKPMYQGARHIIIGSPAFFLILARSVEDLRGRRALFWLAGLALLLGPTLSLTQLYTDPAYAKDDLRGLVRYIEERAGDNDIVVYNNAILLPLHDHYIERADLPVTALPTYPLKAGPETAEKLAALSSAYERIWFVPVPPADGRDQEGEVRQWLSSHLLTIERHREHSQNTVVEVIGYSARPWQLTSLPSGTQQLAVQWPKMPGLRGWQGPAHQSASESVLWLDLYWQGAVPPAGDARLRFILRGPDGSYWLDDNRPFWIDDLHEAFLGSPLVRLNYGLSLPYGTPPGDYELLVLPWSATTGVATGEPALLGTVSLDGDSTDDASAQLSMNARFPLLFENGLKLLGVASKGREARPGNPFPLSIYWAVEDVDHNSSEPAVNEENGRLQYELQVIGPDNTIWVEQASQPGPDWLAPSSWPHGTPLREQLGLSFPPETPPGVYHLRWRLLAGNEPVPGRPSWRPWLTEWVSFGEVVVQEWPLETELPDAEHVVQARFGEAIQLYGYDLSPPSPSAGGLLTLTLYWQALSVPEENEYVFVHVVAEDETIVTQADRVPVNSWRPTTSWRANEVLEDQYQLFLPSELEAGAYRVYVGLYEPSSELRLAVTVNGALQPDGRLLLTSFTLP